MPEKEPTWGEYSRLVLSQIEANTEAIKEIGNNMHALRNEVGAKIGEIRLQTVRDLAELEQRVGSAHRGEITNIRTHFDEEIEKVQRAFDTRVTGVTSSFEGKIRDLNTTLTDFTKRVGDKMDALNASVTALNVKSGMWGAAGSILGVIAVWLAMQLPKIWK